MYLEINCYILFIIVLLGHNLTCNWIDVFIVQLTASLLRCSFLFIKQLHSRQCYQYVIFSGCDAHGCTQRGRSRGGPWPSPKSLGEYIWFSLQGKMKIRNIKRRLQKWKREDFNYVSKGMLKLIISNIAFWTECLLTMKSYFFKPSESCNF